MGLGSSMIAPQLHAQQQQSSSACRGIVFLINGAGGFDASIRSIRKAVASAKVPLEVRTFSWTHGFCRVLSDQMHEAHQKEEGQKLANVLRSCRNEAPGQPIYLLGHSAGCGVALLAAENLPPDTLTRIVLLAPAVSSKHDLRAALRSSCWGIDVFISSHDWVCLGLGTLVVGTTDRCRTARTGGKAGFQPILFDPEDAALYAKLRQYPWDPSLQWTGHMGGHYGTYQPEFFRTFVLPLLQE
jgi:hypothetical protein